MRYAKVVVGLPVDELFDYSIPEDLIKPCAVGCRVGVSFGRRNLIGYVVGLSLKTKIRKIKPISRLIDFNPILDSNFLKLTKVVADYYCSSWGQAIESALPVGLRKGLTVGEGQPPPKADQPAAEAVPWERVRGRPEECFKVYCERIEGVFKQNKSVLLLAPEIKQCLKLFNLMKARYPDKRIELTYRKLKIKDELSAWEKAANGWVDLLIGTRAAVFSSLPNLGLIIIEREDSYGYKEEQTPHYHTPEVGLTRSHLEGIPLVLSSQSLSLDAYYSLREKKYSSIDLTPKDLKPAKITIVDLRQYGKRMSGMLFSPVLEDKLNKAIPAGKKALIFINRKGYARFAHCQKCGFVLLCDKCSSKLIFHFDEKKLICSSCGLRTDLLRICPGCHSHYIKYSGFGIEKVVSQLNLYFPQAKIVRLDKEHQDIPPDFQIVAATEKIFHCDIQPRFDLSAVIDLDSALHMVDFRNNEKLYRLLDELRSLTKEELVIQTRIPEQYQNKEFLNLELPKLFERELKERKELRLPPYTHLTRINLRGKNLERVKSAAFGLYEKLKSVNKDFEIFEPLESTPSKLRGNFRFYMLLKAKNQLKLSKFLKKQLKKIRYSGVILTVEVDPE